jgi:hypothetical protein
MLAIKIEAAILALVYSKNLREFGERESALFIAIIGLVEV